MRAMGTQKEIAKLIAKDNDCVLVLKGNHGDLDDNVKMYFELEDLPVVFKEDSSRSRKSFLAQNFSMLRKIALNAFKSLDSRKSINMIRKKCRYDSSFRTEVLDAVLSKEM